MKKNPAFSSSDQSLAISTDQYSLIYAENPCEASHQSVLYLCRAQTMTADVDDIIHAADDLIEPVL